MVWKAVKTQVTNGIKSKYCLEAIRDSLLQLSANWGVISDVEFYIPDASTVGNYGNISTLQLYNTVTEKYIRFWWFASGSTTPSSGSFGYMPYCTFYDSPISTLPSEFAQSLRVYRGNFVTGAKINPISASADTSAATRVFSPCTLMIGIAGHSIDKNLASNLNLDIPIFGFMGVDQLYNSGAAFSTYNGFLNRPNLHGSGNNFLSGTASAQYRPKSLSYSSTENLFIASDGEGFYIVEEVWPNGVSTSSCKVNCACIYHPNMFENIDTDDTRIECGLSFNHSFYDVTSLRYIDFASYVDKNGNKVPDGAIVEYDLRNIRILSQLPSDVIFYAPCIPTDKSDIRSSYANGTTVTSAGFSSYSLSKGKISTDLIRIVDHQRIKYGATLDGGKWVCVQDGVLFPSDPSNPSLV